MWFFQMSREPICLAHMGGNIIGGGVESIFWTDMCNLLSNSCGGGVLWFEHARAMEGVGNLCLIEGKMNKYVYCEVLEMELMNTIHMNDLGEEDVIFQHDNDPKHTFKYVTNWWLAQKISFHLASGSIT